MAQEGIMVYCQGSVTLTEKHENRPSSTFERMKDCSRIQTTSNIDATGLELISETLPGLLKHRANTAPNALALDSYTCEWTYAQLDSNVTSAAQLFRDHGIRPGQKVGLCSHLSPWAVVSILAAMKIGAAVVPVDPIHPPARRKIMLRESMVENIIVEDSSSFHDLRDSRFSLVDVSGITTQTAQVCLASGINGLGLDPKSDAFVAFTSGSTGTPKGIIQTHEGIVTMSKMLARELHVDASSRVAQFHPYIFDVSMMEIGMCLATGGVLCISEKEDMMMPSPGEVGNQLNKSRITHVTLTPTMLETIDPEDVPTVQVMSTMGEPLGLLAVERWASTDKRTFVQLWGCTEATILQTVTAPIVASHAPRNVGAAIKGACRLWVADPANVNILMANGEAGELVVESRALAKGYLNQAKETSNSFISSAAWMDTSSCGRWYKTGDLACKHHDGTVTFLGRLDSQINYHGDRVELGEIDYHISEARSRLSLDCFSDFHATSQTIVGFVCGSRRSAEQTQSSNMLLSWDEADTATSTVQQLMEELLESGDLAEYMVPRFWIPISRRPLTISGKTDRSYLQDAMQTLSKCNGMSIAFLAVQYNSSLEDGL